MPSLVCLGSFIAAAALQQRAMAGLRHGVVDALQQRALFVAGMVGLIAYLALSNLIK